MRSVSSGADRKEAGEAVRAERCSADVGALQECDQPLAELAGQLRLAEPPCGVDRALVRVDEGDARRTTLDVPLEQLGLVSRKHAVDVIGEQVDAFRASQIVALVVHPVVLPAKRAAATKP